MSIAPHSSPSEELSSCSHFYPTLRRSELSQTPSPEEIITVARKIESFTSRLIPLTSDRCLKRYSGCLSCPPQNCVHSGGGAPLLELCHCWTCCFGKTHGKDIRDLHLFLKELTKQHNVHCVADTILRKGISLGVVMRQQNNFTEEQKEILKGGCKNPYELDLEEAKDKITNARNQLICASYDRSHNLYLILELWKSSKKSDARDLSNTFTLWVQNKEGQVSPFCSHRLESFLSSLTLFSLKSRRSGARVSPSQAAHLALQVQTTLSCILSNSKYKESLLSTVSIEEEVFPACSTELIFCILIASLEAEGKLPSLRNKALLQYFPKEISELITSSAETFRKTLLGEFLLCKRPRKKGDPMDVPAPKQQMLKLRTFSEPILSIKVSSATNDEDEEDPEEGPSTKNT
ncbi:hypothetical protein [Chlamydiifrater phoenicopteri]|uniref:hypothetical protein n=1 Tax=Chlamydiifrater phoenicopteri TaxID=2681469 RepID=UPI001BCF8DCA|nr:hypothetical protein [Chlamydiifrater phoenicopteri]